MKNKGKMYTSRQQGKHTIYIYMEYSYELFILYVYAKYKMVVNCGYLTSILTIIVNIKSDVITSSLVTQIAQVLFGILNFNTLLHHKAQ